jgi:hypothetical protein
MAATEELAVSSLFNTEGVAVEAAAAMAALEEVVAPVLAQLGSIPAVVPEAVVAPDILMVLPHLT